MKEIKVNDPIVMGPNEVERAKAILKAHGYYVDNLWHVRDVINYHGCGDKEAYDILDQCLTSERIVDDVFYLIKSI